MQSEKSNHQAAKIVKQALIIKALAVSAFLESALRITMIPARSSLRIIANLKS